MSGAVSGRRICIWSEKTSFASTPCTGPPFLWPPDCQCRRSVGARLVLIDAGKMSKSKGNVVQPRPMRKCWEWTRCVITCCAKRCLARTEISVTDALVQRYNSDLATGLGI